MEEEKIRQLLEEIDPDKKIPQDKKEEIIVAIKEHSNLKNGETRGGVVFHALEQNLKRELEIEDDWRKKASIAAKIISMGLE